MKNYIVLHHSALPFEEKQALRVKAEHLTRLKQNGAYHYFIEKDGEVVQFRDEASIGYHSGVFLMNVLSVGICLAGDLREGIQNPTEAQIKSLNQLIPGIQSRWGIEKRNILLHSMVKPTACPGRDLRNYIIELPEIRLRKLEKALKFARGARRMLIQKLIERLSARL